MALFRSLLRAFTERAFAGGDSADDATRLLSTVVSTNDYIARTHGRSNMFATAFVAVLAPATGSAVWVNAGHEAPVVGGPSGNPADRLEPTGPALGMMPDMAFRARETVIAPGETLFAFTDGVTDSKDPSGRFFTEERPRDRSPPTTSR